MMFAGIWRIPMTIRKSYLLISAAIVLPGFALRAEDCTLSGVTVAQDGSAVPGVQVSVVGMRAFRAGAYKNVTSGRDGNFTVPNLPCGKYIISAMHQTFDATMPTYPGYLTIDIKKEPKVRLVIPNVDKLATMLRAPSSPGAESDGINGAEDPAISLLRRQYFERISASQLGEFDAASISQKKNMFMLAFSSYLAGVMVGDAEAPGANGAAPQSSQKAGWRAMMGRRPQLTEDWSRVAGTRIHATEDATAKRQLANAAAIVRQTLPAEDVSIFGRGPEMEQARLFLRAVAALPKSSAQCSMYALWAVDTADSTQGYGSMGAYVPFSDDLGPVRWAELGTAAKCKVLDAGRPKSIESAQKIERDESIDTVRAVAQRIDPTQLGPKHTILQAFGSAGLAKYEQAKSTDAQLELYRAALIMQLCWYAAYLAL
jgi:hypothetical protein